MGDTSRRSVTGPNTTGITLGDRIMQQFQADPLKAPELLEDYLQSQERTGGRQLSPLELTDDIMRSQGYIDKYII